MDSHKILEKILKLQTLHKLLNWGISKWWYALAHTNIREDDYDEDDDEDDYDVWINKSISDILHLQHLPSPHHHLFVYFNVYLFVCYNHSQDHHYSQYHHHPQYHHHSHDCHHFQDINQHHHLIYHLLHSYLIQLFCFLTCY